MKKILGLILVCTLSLLTSATASATALVTDDLVVIADLGVDDLVVTPLVSELPLSVEGVYVGDLAEAIPLYATETVNDTKTSEATYSYTDNDVGWNDTSKSNLGTSNNNYKDLPLLVPLK